MGSLVSRRPVRVEHESQPGEYIEIKPKLSEGDRRTLQDRAFSVSAKGDKVEATIRAGEWQFALLELSIVGWHLLDEDGQPVEFKPGRVADLDPDSPLVDRVLAEVAARNPTSTDKSGNGG